MGVWRRIRKSKPKPKPKKMSLLTRLIDPLPGEEKLPVHQFMAGLAEVQRGHITKQQLIVEFNLNQAEQQQLNTWLNTGNTDRLEVHDILLLGENGNYPLSFVQSRLGL